MADDRDDLLDAATRVADGTLDPAEYYQDVEERAEQMVVQEAGQERRRR